jgi:hypothetical protein
MSLSLAVLLVLIAIGWFAVLTAMIRNDGHGPSRIWADQHRPPRSHVPDTFEPLAR